MIPTPPPTNVCTHPRTTCYHDPATQCDYLRCSDCNALLATCTAKAGATGDAPLPARNELEQAWDRFWAAMQVQRRTHNPL